MLQALGVVEFVEDLMGIRLALDVGIVGSGYAGCAAALLLERAGQRVTLYEEVLKPCGIGAGIVLQPTGMRVLAELGLLEDALSRGARLESLLCRTSNGRTLVDLRYAELGSALFGFTPMRRQMLRTMVGVKRGLLRGGVPLDAICAALPSHTKVAASRDPVS